MENTVVSLARPLIYTGLTFTYIPYTWTLEIHLHFLTFLTHIILYLGKRFWPSIPHWSNGLEKRDVENSMRIAKKIFITKDALNYEATNPVSRYRNSQVDEHIYNFPTLTWNEQGR